MGISWFIGLDCSPVPRLAQMAVGAFLSAQLLGITHRRTMTTNISQTIVQMVATGKTAGEIMGCGVVEMIIAVRMEWHATLSIYRQ